MLKQLHIENLAIITTCDMSFDTGMTVLTGETGAGKSIVVDAIGLLLGRQASDDWIKSDADYAIVEAVFQVSRVDLAPDLQTFVDDLDIVSVTRKLTRGKPSVARINGQLVPLKLLKALMSPLITIIGQHEHMNLMDADAQRRLLDAFGDKTFQGICQHYTEIFKEYGALKSEYEHLKKMSDEQATRTEFLKFQLEDISKHMFLRGEDEALNDQKKQLKLADKKHALSTQALQAGSALFEASKQLDHTFLSLRDHFPETQAIYEDVSDLHQRISDITFSVEKSLQMLQKDIPLDAEGLEQRLDLIFRYKQKYRVATLDALCDLEETFKNELEALSVVDQSLTVIEERYTTLSESLKALGEELHKKRLGLAKDIQKNVVQVMEKLSFSHADFRISVEKETDKWTESGCDIVSFLVSTNAGEPPKPLSKIASGGELSRIMLAFRVVFCDANTKETMIFDEVDAGIGGLTANTVGELLKRVSEHSQVVCVTHLPQVAQFSDRHLVVEKKMENGKTTTQLRLLMSGERDMELKRMVGGDSVVEKMGLRGVSL